MKNRNGEVISSCCMTDDVKNMPIVVRASFCVGGGTHLTYMNRMTVNLSIHFVVTSLP